MNDQHKVANEIFKSIDIITDKKIQDTPFTMSVTGRVVERIKGSDMYKVNYQNEEIRAVSMGAAYSQGDMVIILVPDKRMDSLKFILGRANDRTPTISVSQTGGLSPAVLAEIQKALETINDISSDDKITPSEKTTLSIQWTSLNNSFNNLMNNLSSYPGVDGSDLLTRYNALKTIMDSILSDMSTTINFPGSELRTAFSFYYAEEQDLRTRILDFIQSQTAYKLEIESSTGSQFINGNIDTVLTAKAFRGPDDISMNLPPSAFVWKKTNHLGESDTAWNTAHVGVGKSLRITSLDMSGKAVFTCELHID